MQNRITNSGSYHVEVVNRYSLLWMFVAFVSVLLIGATNSGIVVAADEFVDLPRDMEIELALSALPEDLQAGASIYLRDSKKGFVLYRKGTNEWMTFVARTSVRFYDADWEYKYPSDQLIPMAFDEVGRAHHFVPFFDIERMRIDGVSAKKAKQVLQKHFSDGTYKAPAKGGLSYMLAPIHRAYMEPAKSDLIMTVSFPHYMPYASYMATEKLGKMDSHGRSGTLDYGGADTGPHGFLYFMVQPDQAKAIRAKYATLLTRLCKHHDNWCLPKATPTTGKATQ